jgi:endoglucanase
MRRTGRHLAVRAAAAAVALALGIAGLVAAPQIGTAATTGGTGTGYLSTDGSRIVDSTGATVELTGINWFGMETDNRTFHGLWAGVTWRSMIDHMAELGYNTIRVPFSGDALKPGATATGINDSTNPDLVGLTPLQILDKVVQYAGEKGMRILLDRHRPSAAGQTPLWYTSTVSEASMIADWKMLAQHYSGNPVVIGADLFNEPHSEGTDPDATGACWGCGDPARDWQMAAERIGNAIHDVNPSWLVVVEGVSCLSGGNANVWDSVPDDVLACDWWGGNLAGAREHPVQLDVANKLVYSAHDYGISVYDHQDWFDTTTHPEFPANLPAIWDHFWGYLVKEDIAPVLVGEFGSTLRDPRDVQWLTTLVDYLDDNGISFTYWSWNPNSGDTGGIVGDDWSTVNTQKQSILSPALVPPVAGSIGGGTSPTPTPTPTTSPVTPGACSGGVVIVNSWPTGFQGSVEVKNTGTTAVYPWKVTFTVPSGVTIGNGWNATFEQSGTTVTVTAPTYGGTLAAGATTSAGFTASGPSSPAPTAVKLNGVACGA